MYHIFVFMFDFRMINISSECEYDWYCKISACWQNMFVTHSPTNFIFWLDRLIYSVAINSHPDNIHVYLSPWTLSLIYSYSWYHCLSSWKLRLSYTILSQRNVISFPSSWNTVTRDLRTYHHESWVWFLHIQRDWR